MWIYVALFLMLPLIAIVLMAGFADATWTAMSKGKELPYSLGAFILFSYSVLCGYVASENIFFSYAALFYATVIWTIGFYCDKNDCFAMQPFKIKHPVMIVMGTTAALFSWYILWRSETLGIINLATTILVFLVFPLVCKVANEKPLRLWKVSLLFLIMSCFFIEVPAFTDVLYGVTVLYIVFVLEGEGQASFGINGALLVGTMMAIWFVSVINTPVYLLLVLLVFAYMGMLFFKKTRGLQMPFFRWIENLGLRDK
ncbi:hypothetical protein [Shouchella patagoniensis]|uniref:hypothetical protein n=1 Tax=Shouchella patagoniensis TaxID=228576 RepID=UPI0009956CD8|nr:hypothetical protein [Shouchella patagoniensis]